MLYTILAVLSSASISLILRFGEAKIKNNFAMFFSNYIVCAIMAKIYMGNFDFTRDGISFAIGLGFFSGFFYLGSFLLLKFNIVKNGVVLAATFAKLGVLVPTIMAITIYHETPRILQLAGIMLSLIAIIIINGGKSEDNPNDTSESIPKDVSEHKSKNKMKRLWLIVLLIVGGFTDSFVNIFENDGNPVLKDQFLFFIFATAAVLCVIMLVVQKHRPSREEIIWGAIVGVPNYFSARFLLLALGKLPAIIVYPAYNIATILIISMVGIGVLKEKMDKRKAIGMGMILASLVLLNI